MAHLSNGLTGSAGYATTLAEAHESLFHGWLCLGANRIAYLRFVMNTREPAEIADCIEGSLAP
jgi:hypothetical protein